MLTRTNEAGVSPVAIALQGGLNGASEATSSETASDANPSRFARVLRVEWIGQTAASLCWIASVFAYGVSSTGDWLQLAAALAWLLANVAAAVASEAD